ncbi:MAG: hypothetical protein EP343_02410 [Deltaproteobacteria bacterium]|nr:MAG: hypothetical protein EP343_02410 [Deltaproteobacteria bacterium]
MKRMSWLWVGLLSFGLVCSLNACKKKTKPAPSTRNVKKKVVKRAAAERNLDALLNHFKAKGLKLTNPKPKIAEMIGAVEGTGVNVNGKWVELYRYEAKKKADMKQGHDQFKKLGAPTQEKGLFLLAYPKGHPAQKQLLAAFQSF